MELIIAGKVIKNRLFLGTGKFTSSKLLQNSIEAIDTQVVTVALRRVDINNKEDDILKAINTKKQILLPNTSGARNASEAVRLAKIARAAGCGN